MCVVQNVWKKQSGVRALSVWAKEGQCELQGWTLKGVFLGEAWIERSTEISRRPAAVGRRHSRGKELEQEGRLCDWRQDKDQNVRITGHMVGIPNSQ